MRLSVSTISSIAATLLALAPVATAEKSAASADAKSAAKEQLAIETIVQKHIAALGGESLLRGGKSFWYTVSGEKMGHKFTKTVYQARPNKMRVDIQSQDGPMSKGFDGKTAWIKKGTAGAESLTPDETLAMKSHAEFEEPLLDYAKKGTAVKLVGKSEVKGTPAYDVEVTFKSGDVEHHYIDASSFLLLRRTFTGKDKDGKATTMSVRFGDYKKVQGRAVNHSIEWDGDDGKSYRSTVTNVSFDKPLDAKLFAMPK